MSVYKKLLDNMVWSYSRLSTYNSCPYAWYRRYIEKEYGEGTFYADNGKAMHTVFEELTSGVLNIEDAPSRYLELFGEIENVEKPHIMDKTFDLCVNYLCEMPEDILEEYHVVGSEIEMNFKIGKYDFIGYIDLLLQDGMDNLIVVDHKSTERFLKKDGKPKASTKEMFDGYKKQIYLYAEAVYQKFGEYPTKLVFHHFKDNGVLTTVPFNKEECEEAKKWALETIKKIYKDEEFLAVPKTGYCWRLCDYRNDCDYKFEDEE